MIDYSDETFLKYNFYSDEPKGTIEKRIWLSGFNWVILSKGEKIMSTIAVNKSGSRKAAPKVDKNMASHADDPFFVKKAKEAKAPIRKYGAPEATNDRS